MTPTAVAAEIAISAAPWDHHGHRAGARRQHPDFPPVCASPSLASLPPNESQPTMPNNSKFELPLRKGHSGTLAISAALPTSQLRSALQMTDCAQFHNNPQGL